MDADINQSDMTGTQDVLHSQEHQVIDDSLPHVETFPTRKVKKRGSVWISDKSSQTYFKSEGTATQVLCSMVQVVEFKKEISI